MSQSLPRLVVIAAATVLGLAGAALVAMPSEAATTDCDATSCSVVVDFTGDTQTFIVPPGVTEISVTVEGAQGGDFVSFGTVISAGGRGGRTQASLVVAPGTSYTVVAGGRGTSATTNLDATLPRTGGYGGGGTSGPAGLWTSGGGGGGSFLFGPSGTLLLAAGGGGGGTSNLEGPTAGGAGGGADAPAGTGTVSGSGGAATAAAGGAGGASLGGDAGEAGQGPTTSDSAFGQGGDGGKGGPVSGAGGGGGYYGGGGGGGSAPNGPGSGGPGGGGSGYAAASAQNLSGAAGVRSGDGRVVIAYSRSVPTLAVSAQPAGSVPVGASVTFTATVASALGTPTGTVAFVFSGAPIPGCGAVPVGANGVATCPMTASAAGHHTVSADYAGDDVFLPVSGSLDYTVTATTPTTPSTPTTPKSHTKPHQPTPTALPATGG